MNQKEEPPQERETEGPKEPIRLPEPDRTDRIEKGEGPHRDSFKGVEKRN